MKQRLLLTLAAIFVALSSWAYGTEINGIYYILDSSTETARVTITGSGVSGDYNPASTAYTGSVTIPSSVTYDGITYSVTSIGNLAFTDCTGLTSVNIPNSVTKIGSFAFDGCSGLTSINIPNSVTTIGKAAFQNCKGLTSINIPNSVTSIEDYTFTYCTKLLSITIGNSVTTIGDYAFFGCDSYYLTSLTIPSSVTSIGERAFSSCTGLTSITIGNSVTTIGEYAFTNCPKLTSITIPSSVTSIGKSAFSSYNNSLTSIEVEAGNTVYDSRNDCNAIIETASNTLLFGCKNTTIPSSVITIGESAFTGCYLTSITIPSSVTTIGESAFDGCYLTSITIPSSVTSIGKDAFSKGYLTSIEVEVGNTVYDSRDNCNAIIETASNTLIAGCKTTTIPSSVTSIGNYAFYRCTGLTSITIPSSVTSIEYAAFSGCTGLTSITIPNSVTSIGEWTFGGCTGLTSITACKMEPSEYNCSTIAFGGVPYSSVTLYVPSGSASAYKALEPWSNFSNIVETDLTSIQTPTISSSSTIVGYYNLQGQRIATPQRGQLIIVRYSDGTSRKMLVQ